MTLRRVGRSRISNSWKMKCELIFILLAIVIFAAGQSRIEARSKPGPGKHTTHNVSGVLHGGRQPVDASTVTLWAVGTTGYGSARTSINSTVSDASSDEATPPSTVGREPFTHGCVSERARRTTTSCKNHVQNNSSG